MQIYGKNLNFQTFFKKSGKKTAKKSKTWLKGPFYWPSLYFRAIFFYKNYFVALHLAGGEAAAG